LTKCNAFCCQPIQANAENDRAAFRKLEARLSLNKEGPELQAKLAKYKHRVSRLERCLSQCFCLTCTGMLLLCERVKRKGPLDVFSAKVLCVAGKKDKDLRAKDRAGA